MRGVLKMAHVDHYKKTERRAIVKEASRDVKEYRNYVDPDRTHLNYTVVNEHDGLRKYGSDISHKYITNMVDDRLKSRVSQYQQETGCQVRSNSVLLSSWVVQCPEVLRGDVDVEKRFFDEVNGFMMKELGKENVMAMFVHYDETTPHCHVHTVPCGHNRKTGKPAIGSNAVYTREYLKDFHVRFNDHMEAVFGIENLIVTEERVTSQRGNLSLTEFKKAKLTEEVEKMTKEVEDIEIYKKKVVSEVLDLQTRQRDLQFNISRLRAHNDELEARNDELKNNNKELTEGNRKLTAQKDWLVKESERQKELSEEWKKETYELVSQHAELSVENKTLKKENEELQNTVKSLKTMYNELVQKAKTLRNKLHWWSKSSDDIEAKRRSRELKEEIENEFPEW